MKRLSLFGLAMVAMILATGFSPATAVPFPLPTTAPCGSYSSGSSKITAHKVLESGEYTYFGFSGVQNLRMLGYLESVSLEKPTDLSAGYIEWGIYNGDTGALVVWGWVANNNPNFIDVEGWMPPDQAAQLPTFNYNKVCIVVSNANSNEVISTSFVFEIYVK